MDFNDNFFDFLVATDQLDNFLGKDNKNEENEKSCGRACAACQNCGGNVVWRRMPDGSCGAECLLF